MREGRTGWWCWWRKWWWWWWQEEACNSDWMMMITKLTRRSMQRRRDGRAWIARRPRHSLAPTLPLFCNADHWIQSTEDSSLKTEYTSLKTEYRIYFIENRKQKPLQCIHLLLQHPALHSQIATAVLSSSSRLWWVGNTLWFKKATEVGKPEMLWLSVCWRDRGNDWAGTCWLKRATLELSIHPVNQRSNSLSNLFLIHEHPYRPDSGRLILLLHAYCTYDGTVWYYTNCRLFFITKEKKLLAGTDVKHLCK